MVVGSEDKLRITCNITRSNPVPKITWQYQAWSCPPSKGYNCDPISNKWQTADPTKFDIRPPTAVAMESVFKVQSTLDRWNLHGTEKNGSIYRMFHLSEWLDEWNLSEIEKKSSTYRTSLLYKISGDRGINEYL